MKSAYSDSRMLGYRDESTGISRNPAIRPISPASRPWSRPTVVLLIVWSVSAAYLAFEANRDWIPHDEGVLAQTAERVLQGELPHRDFDDTYTGGLALLHALAFRLFGTSLLSLRLALLLFGMAFVATVYRIAVRALTPWLSGLVTLLCVAWTLPNYFAGLPSWYNLFFAAFGTLALLRYAESDRARWLFAAGLCGGASVLMKAVVGLFYVAAALLFLVYRDQATLRPGQAGERKGDAGAKLVDALIALALTGFCAALVLLVSRRPTAMDVLHFAAPGMLLVAFLAWNRWRLRGWLRDPGRPGFLASALAFGAGVLLPVAAFLVPYALSGSLGLWYEGVFVAPQRRFEFASLGLPPLASLGTAVPLASLLAVALAGGRLPRAGLRGLPWLVGATAIALAGALAYGREAPVYRAVWDSLRPSVPLVTLAGCLLLATTRGARMSPLARQQLFLLVAMAAMTSLVQFPFAAGIYFCYAMPPAALAIAFVLKHGGRATGGLAVCLLCFYLAFAALWLNRASTYPLGFGYRPIDLSGTLDMQRGGLRVSPASAERYREVVSQVTAHSAEGSYIYASPDSPEVYFLAGRRNPTRTFFEIFDPDLVSDPAGRDRRILDVLEERQVDVVVLRRVTEFTRGLSRSLVAELLKRYPRRLDLPAFLVLWRERPQAGE